MSKKIEQEQKELCARSKTSWVETPLSLKVGISEDVFKGLEPVHGLRHPPEEGTSGWFIWVGELSQNPNFFKPYHAAHLIERCPEISKYLGLPPGWRFLIARDHEDVWEDPTLLNV